MGKDIPRNSGQQPKCYEGVLCSMQYAFWYREDNKLSGRHDVKRHIERAASTLRKGPKAQSRLGSINRFVAGCEIDKVTSSEIAFAIFIAKHNLSMAVGDEFGLLAKKMWCSTVPVAHPGGEKILTTAFHAFSSGLSRFFVR